MKKLDEKLRKTPEEERRWLRAFQKARRGFYYLNLYKDNTKLGFAQGAEYFQERAELLLTEALQELFYNFGKRAQNSELAQLIEKSLEEIETRRVAA